MSHDHPTLLSIRAQHLAFGFFLIAVAVGMVLLMGEIESIDRGDRDPGPRAFPQVLAGLFFVGAVWQFVEAWRATSKTESNNSPPNLRKLAAVAGMLACYLVALPFVGFALSTAVFIVVLNRLTGSPWWVSILAAVVLIAIVQTVFVGVFQVRLPEGQLGFPF